MKNYTAILVLLGLFWLGAIVIWGTFSKESKASQCNRLVNVINEATSANSGMPGRTIAEDDAVLTQNAEKLDNYATQLDGMSFGDATIRRFQSLFSQLYREISAANRSVVAAPSHDLRAVRQANNTLITVQERESPLVQEVNQYCHTP